MSLFLSFSVRSFDVVAHVQRYYRETGDYLAVVEFLALARLKKGAILVFA